jgi:enoyl-CoA hydratase
MLRMMGMRRLMSSSSSAPVLTEVRGKVGLITLNRPKALNALNPELMGDLADAADKFDADPNIGAIVLTGAGEKAFVAGADIKFMSDKSYMDMFKARMYANEFERIGKVKKAVIAAVNGFCLGGGCELAMACDFILAADTARFGQPEIKLGTIPGIGGTQRFTRALGKARAMELILTGDMMGAEEACTRGLVARVVPAGELIDDALKTAGKIADMSQPIVTIAKDCVVRARALRSSDAANRTSHLPLFSFCPFSSPLFPSSLSLFPLPRPSSDPWPRCDDPMSAFLSAPSLLQNASFESSLAEGLRLERALFYSTFATADQKIGMKAFIDKASPEFKHE